MGDLLVIVPSRSRPESVQELAETFFGFSDGNADLMFGTDDDQPEYPVVDRVLYRRGRRLRMCGTLNAIAVEQAPNYKYIGFLGDDHRPRTQGWDTRVIEALKCHNVVYGNDLIWGEGLPTAVFLRSEVIQKLGYMAPPNLIHLYLDNFWLELGKRTSIEYLPGVVIEHMHPCAGKATWTPEYNEVNDPALFAKDKATFEHYIDTQFEDDLRKLA